jgi:hypothetical protein
VFFPLSIPPAAQQLHNGEETPRAGYALELMSATVFELEA